MKKIILAVVLVVVAVVSTLALREYSTRATKQKWISETLEKLKQFDPNKHNGPVSFQAGKKRDDGTYAFVVTDGEGVIRVGNDGWVYIITHSLHDEDPERILIGDQIFAIDHTGSIYRNKSHVCGAIELESRSPAGFASIEDFLSNSIQGHRAGEFVQWEKYTEE